MHIGFFDGSASPNPGKIGLGVCICFQQTVICKSAKPGGTGTNNAAEYKALIHLLDLAIAMKIRNITVYGDSQLVVNQVNGDWTVSTSRLKQYYDRVIQLQSCFTQFTLKWIPRKQNGIADELSREGLRLSEVKTVHIQLETQPHLPPIEEAESEQERSKSRFSVQPLGDYRFRINQDGHRAVVLNLKSQFCSCDDYRLNKTCSHLNSINHILKKQVA